MKKSIRLKKIIPLIFLGLFIILFIFSSVKVINYIRDSKKNEKVYEEILKDVIAENVSDNDNRKENKYKINFDSLKKKNNDTVGYIKINGTNIEQVVVKGKDNNYYLHHNFEKQENSAGWVFADYRNKLDDTDKNIVIYGHNMRNDTMFGTLKNVLSLEWQENEEYRKIHFITENESAIYDVFSVYQIKDEDYYMKIDFETEQFKKYIDVIKSRSVYNFKVEVTEDDNILTLSTCANNNKYRVVVHAKKE